MNFNAYIDEAGDEGFKFTAGSSRWFVLTGIVVPQPDDKASSRVIDRVKQLFGTRDPMKPLHWRNLKHRQKLAYIKAISETKTLKAMIVALDKTRLRNGTPLAVHPRMYLYLCRYLLEGVSCYVRDAARGPNVVDVFFANRSSISYADLERYIETVQISPDSKIAKGVLGRIVPQQLQQKKLLQVADAIASSAFEALNPDAYGNTDPNYFKPVSPLLYRCKNTPLGYGFQSLPDDERDLKAFEKEYPWIVDI